MNLPKYFLLMFSGAIALLVSGCSGGGASTTNNVTGVAATGAAINGTVCLQDAATHEVCMKTADGHYSFDVTGLTPPFILKASWNDNGITKELYSMAAGKGVANISPLTNAIVTVAATVAPATLYATPTLTAMQAAASNLSAATTKIITSLAPLLQEFAVATDINPITITYNVNHAGLDGFLDSTRFSFSNNAMTLTNSVTGDLLFYAPNMDIDHGVSAMQWGSAEGRVAEDPSVAVDNNGNALVVWIQQDTKSGIYNIESKWLHGGRASARVSDGITSCVAPKVRFSQNGIAHVVWYQATPYYTSIWYAKYVPGTGWTESTRVSQHPSTFAFYPQLAVDAAGNVAVVWYEANPPVGNHFDVYAANFTNGAWNSPIQLSDVSHSAYRPVVATNDAGQAVAVWAQDLGNGSVSNDYKEIAVSRWNGTTWSTPVKINDIPGTTIDIAAYAAVAVDSNGNPLVLWSQGVIRATWYINGVWSASQDITNGSIGGCAFPEVAFYAPGKAMAVWAQHNGVDRNDVVASQFSADTGWSIPSYVNQRKLSIDSPHLAVDASGTAVVVWVEGMYLTDPPAMMEALYFPITGWSTPISLAVLTDTSGMYVPVTAIGANRAGLAYSAWGLDSL